MFKDTIVRTKTSTSANSREKPCEGAGWMLDTKCCGSTGRLAKSVSPPSDVVGETKNQAKATSFRISAAFCNVLINLSNIRPVKCFSSAVNRPKPVKEPNACNFSNHVSSNRNNSSFLDTEMTIFSQSTLKVPMLFYHRKYNTSHLFILGQRERERGQECA